MWACLHKTLKTFGRFFLKGSGSKVNYVIVEVEPTLPLQGTTEDHILAVRQLEHSPGFQYLIRKFRLQKAVLQAHLLRDQHRSMLQVVRLQEGIRWMGWLEDQLSRALAWKKPQVENPQADLLSEFEKVHRQLFGVDPKP